LLLHVVQKFQGIVGAVFLGTSVKKAVVHHLVWC